jgi:hypothetical protein
MTFAPDVWLTTLSSSRPSAYEMLTEWALKSGLHPVPVWRAENVVASAGAAARARKRG